MVVSRILRPILGRGQRVHQTGDGPVVLLVGLFVWFFFTH
ncbi:hypothetical protein HMPREF0281_01896 [Corynebacterium ammoniagenes DSM 20306]|uniref:Uncharacterized protein n=1 Tax=Corynebacterium ammoniagenes DSM 20306 TaxID=649754 RepID=A0ABN0ADI5_CORAM|nr:hypothetical protein HMPREF0281_01896 [Corynebacterium ammoniagenes DSM 20306]